MQHPFLSSKLLRRVGALAILLAACAMTGCSKTAKVTGKVTFAGKPLLAGRVSFTGPGNVADTADIEDGVYTMAKAPVGLCKIAVDTAFLKPPPGGQTPTGPANQPNLPPEGREKLKDKSNDSADKFAEMAKKYTEIPIEYSVPDQSKITYTVKGGSQTFDIDLVKPAGWVPGKMPTKNPGGG